MPPISTYFFVIGGTCVLIGYALPTTIMVKIGDQRLLIAATISFTFTGVFLMLLSAIIMFFIPIP